MSKTNEKIYEQTDPENEKSFRKDHDNLKKEVDVEIGLSTEELEMLCKDPHSEKLINHTKWLKNENKRLVLEKGRLLVRKAMTTMMLKEHNNIKADINASEAKRDKLKAEVEELSKKEEELKKTNGDLKEKNQKLLEEKNQLETQKLEALKICKEGSEIKQQLQYYQLSLDRLKEMIQESYKEYEKQKESEKQINEAIDIISPQIDQLKSENCILSDEKMQLVTEINKLNEEKITLNKEIQNKREKTSQLRNEEEELKERKTILEEENANLEQTIKLCEANFHELEQKVKEQEEVLNTKRIKVDALEKRWKGLEEGCLKAQHKFALILKQNVQNSEKVEQIKDSESKKLEDLSVLNLDKISDCYKKEFKEFVKNLEQLMIELLTLKAMIAEDSYKKWKVKWEDFKTESSELNKEDQNKTEEFKRKETKLNSLKKHLKQLFDETKACKAEINRFIQKETFANSEGLILLFELIKKVVSNNVQNSKCFQDKIDMIANELDSI